MLPNDTWADAAIGDNHKTVWDGTNVVGREAMAAYLQDGESVLDVGVGNARVYRIAKGRGLVFSRYVGVDLSTKFLAATKELCPELETYHMDAADLQFPDNSFDTVILMHMVEELNTYEPAILEALRVCKNRVIVCFWKGLSDKEEHYEEKMDEYGGSSTYSRKQWFAWVENMGFNVYPWLEVHDVDPRTNLFFILEKKQLKGIIAKTASPEVQQAIDTNTPPPQVQPNVYTEPPRAEQSEDLTWNPLVDIPEAPVVENTAPKVQQFKGLGETGMLKTAVVDSDDLYDGDADPYELLLQFKEKFPKFKITLFTIPMKCSQELIEKYKKLDWVELAVHGYKHDTNREFEDVTYEQANFVIPDGYNKFPGAFKKVFKAPGWQISVQTLQWLKDNDWAVMDQHWNNDKRPKGLNTLVYADEPNPENKGAMNIVHTHTWECMGNGFAESIKRWHFLDENTEFKFVSEVVTPWA